MEFKDNYVLDNEGDWAVSFGSSAGEITGNIIAGNDNALRVGNDGHVTISNNLIFNNTANIADSASVYRAVVYLIGRPPNNSNFTVGLDVKNNTIVGNVGEVSVGGSVADTSASVLFNNNNIYDNVIYDNVGTLTTRNQLGVDDFNAENNYWGTSDASAIATKVTDWNDDSSLNFVDYTPHQTTLITSNLIAPPTNVVKEAITGGVKISWTANSESDVAGYKIHYGSGTGYSYATTLDAGNVTSYDISGLSTPDEVAVTAYDGNADGTDDQIEGYQSWFVVSGDAAAGISLSNTSLNFGVVATGSSQAQTLTLTNVGSADLTVTGISSSNNQFSVSPSSVTLSAGSSQNISITFTPSAVGSASSTLTISHNAGSGSSTTTLTAYASASSGTAVKGQISSDTT